MKLTDKLYDRQINLIQDPSKRKAVLHGRRAGVSTALACYLITECLENDGATCLYLAQTRSEAKTIMRNTIDDINEANNLDATYNLAELSWTFPNGSKLLLGGLNTQEKYRGKYRLVVISEFDPNDESLEDVIEQVFNPMLFDCDGTLVLDGLPGRANSGYWYDVSTHRLKGWSVHDNWTVADNPKLPRWHKDPNWRVQAHKLLAEVLEKSPDQVREWLGVWE